MSVNLPKLTLVLGGVASGKSRFAEELTSTAGLPRVYIATAQGLDIEMKEKITKHQRQRVGDWRVIETPLSVAETLGELAAGNNVLIDCLTLWLSNTILAEDDVDDLSLKLIAALQKSPNPIICVSNELGMAPVPPNALGRKFQIAQGRLNQLVAAQADLVVLVSAGLPQVLKGQLP